ncbi:VOC family protein [Candidatus Nanohalovita haloferacivicina]|uniref:VOC family protein n=1 Tax=Candidatus Nanohalovita haloferacivicina TaxID=2978046 RepID=UPI00325FD054|nr:Glyoxalase family protein [Candidatus Nanohalobia archaeon BNXNv]
MKPEVWGLHHFTAIAGDPTENAKFYVNTLGLRMVKKTVNHDAPEMYHLFYGDREGSPGTSVTFFPGMAEQKGKAGAGMITELGLRIPENSVSYWKERLEDEKVDFEEKNWHGKETLSFEDPDGLSLRLVPEDNEEYKTWEDSTVPEKNQIQGMYHVTVQAHDSEDLEKVLDIMNLEKEEEFENKFFRAEDGSGVEIIESAEHGRMGRGSVHHTAFKAAESEEELENWRDQLIRIGLRPSPVISRKYFSSIYCRMPTGVLFEFSTMGPGYTADESVEELGSNFVLPEELQDRREQILENLPEFREEEINQ